MSSEKRMIKINPDLFKVSDKNTSRKGKEKSEIKIKVKSERPVKNISLRRSVMKMIREKQQEEYKKLFSNDREKNEIGEKNDEKSGFNKDFENSLEYFNSLVEKEKVSTNNHNHTIKRYSEETPIYENVLPNVCNDIVVNAISHPIHIQRNMVLPPNPKYGCLKNGSLPTYRNFYNTTRRTYVEPQIHSQLPIHSERQIHNQVPIHSQNHSQQQIHSQNHSQQQIHSQNNSQQQIHSQNNSQQQIHSQVPINNEETKKDLSEKRQKFQMGQLVVAGKKRMKYLKRRKIYKRTYKIGRSQTKPQVSVLVSNKTIRNRITTEAQLLKQTPIHDVKQFLVKKGFIKVGSLTPNDVLRKMYESVSLICGEIQNHNPENLLYNFMNDTQK